MELLRKYHERGVDIRACVVEGWEGDESIILAAANNRVDVIRLLHELLGGDVVNAPDKDGDTLLSTAGYKSSVETVRVLCELGAAVNAAQEISGKTAVWIAA